MLRSLFGSTVLLTTAFFTVQAHAATFSTSALELPTLKISGQTSFNNWFFQNKRKTVQKGNDVCGRQKYGRGQLFTVDNSKIKFTVSGKLDTGMEYGMAIVLDGNRNKDKVIRENYLFFEGTWGKIFAGDTYGVQDFMSFGGFSEWGGTGFMDGPLDRVVNFTTGTVHSIDLVGDTSRNTKLTYVSPRWNGIQAGVSYTPQTQHIGEANISNQTSPANPKEPFGADNVAGGINFIHKFANGFYMALSGTAIFDNARPEYHGARKRHHTASFAFGGDFRYDNVGFGVEYGNNGRSRLSVDQPRFHKANAGQWLDFGLSYTWGSTKFGTGFYYAWRNALGEAYKRKKAKTKAVQASVDQKLAPGLGVYLEYSYIQMRNPAAVAETARINQVLDKCKQSITPTKDSNAQVFIIGSRLVF
jgi:outer membrane protein OmpU